MKNMKKIIAWTSAFALLAMSTAFAAQIGTISWGTGTTVQPTDTTFSGSTQVDVSATVAPTLSMGLDTNGIALGTLAPGVTSSGSVVLTTATNAEGGITVDMAAQGLASSTKSIWALVKWGTDAATGSGTYQVESSTDASGTPYALDDVAASQTVLTTDNVAKSNAVTTVKLSATADNLTEAGSYGDTLTFTVTGNF
ncbi:MAG: hypothetical protein ACD_2C00104G0006 [uncultured bacterium (gcode 4)]|uniref:Uncharacterized protein n=1 Tax=uncultured bacterium (gcode 4) TaxID=1234023 RepID=K2G3H1_9BACT|nr:MAG: hypothetical protein ACD_2C00104G0006 [uncultured bacterium (gcode 4)]